MHIDDPRLPQNFWDKIIPEPNSGCWLWVAANSRGYGQFKFLGKVHQTHRIAYVAARGPIPFGLQLDHLCRMPSCCNPQHLEAVTMAVNIRRGLVGEHLRTRTHCPKGHAYDAANTYVYAGSRCCKECRRDRVRAFRLKVIA